MKRSVNLKLHFKKKILSTFARSHFCTASRLHKYILREVTFLLMKKLLNWFNFLLNYYYIQLLLLLTFTSGWLYFSFKYYFKFIFLTTTVNPNPYPWSYFLFNFFYLNLIFYYLNCYP